MPNAVHDAPADERAAIGPNRPQRAVSVRSFVTPDYPDRRRDLAERICFDTPRDGRGRCETVG